MLRPRPEGHGRHWHTDPAGGYHTRRLSELSVQESYSYELGRVHVGASDHDALDAAWDELEQMLTFEIDPVR